MQNNVYLVIGLGDTGFSCIKYLLSKNQAVIVADTRNNPPRLVDCQQQFPSVEIHLGAFKDDVFSKATMIVVSPGVSLKEPCIQAALKKNISVIGDVELFVKDAKAPIVAITGSNGKSTLTTLMGDMINQAGKKAIICGNIGVPVLDCLALPTPDYYVIELSSFQLDTTKSLKAAVAVVINVSPDHMDRYATVDEYCVSKQHIYQHCLNAVINADEPWCWKNVTFKNPPVAFTLQKPAMKQFGVDDGYLAFGEEKLIAISDLFLQQRHNNQNYLAALAMGVALHLPLEKMLETLRHFEGLSHRCQRVKSNDGVIWYNDSKGTNVGASIAAIESVGHNISKKILLIAGGDSKGADLTPLQPVVKKYVSRVILLGRDAPLLEAALMGYTEITRVATVREAVAFAKNLAQPGDIVLLSPACASLDQYKNYAERGNDFVSAVMHEAS